MTAKIYHNPRCSKSRETLGLLEEHGSDFETVKYLETPPSVADLEEILVMLDCTPQDIMRKGEEEYKTAGLDNPDLTVAEQLALMVANPKVIERPIVVANGKAVIGRPPKNVLDIL